MNTTKISNRIDLTRLPKHVAFIMDGNGRWALKRGMPFRWMGHRRGYSKMIEAVERCAEIGIKVASIYGFSTENWNRPQEELDEIFRLIRDNMVNDTERLIKNGIRVVSMGDITRFPKDLQEQLATVQERTKKNTKCIFNLCINYSGKSDIIQAIKKIKDVQKITEENFGKHLLNSDLPDPDFIVRTSGEYRTSNYMMWQAAYSEWYFPKLMWPEINAKFVDKCIVEFQKRKRRFGGIK